MSNNENEQSLRAIIDMIRMASVFILALHVYYFFYQAFEAWHLTTHFTERIIRNLAHTGLFRTFHTAKWIALGLLFLSQLGMAGKKEVKQKKTTIALLLGAGLALYFSSGLLFVMSLTIQVTQVAMLYIFITAAGYLCMMSGASRLSRLIKLQFNKDIFNALNETFPQEETLIENEYSINLPAEYAYRGKNRQSFINVISPHRAVLIAGSGGAGKSYFIIRHAITQALQKKPGHTMMLYDFKFPDLSLIAYNTWLKCKDNYKIKPAFFYVNFDDLNKSHRCNPLDPLTMHDLTDATESARSILLGLNRSWIKKQGDFFVSSRH